MLKPQRKADRAEMVRQLRALAKRTGAAMTLAAEGSHPVFYARGFHTSLALNGLAFGLRVDGKRRNEKNNAYVVSWYMRTECDKQLSSAFEVLCGYDSVNHYHRQKATLVVTGFERLMLDLETCLEAAADGTAFDPPLPKTLLYRIRVFYRTKNDTQHDHTVDVTADSLTEAYENAYGIVRQLKPNLTKIDSGQLIGQPIAPEKTT